MLDEVGHLGERHAQAQCLKFRAGLPQVEHGQVFQPVDELVAVVGKKAKHLTEENALSCILGYTLGNDLSERGWQASDRTLWRGKNCDTWKPMASAVMLSNVTWSPPTSTACRASSSPPPVPGAVRCAGSKRRRSASRAPAMAAIRER